MILTQLPLFPLCLAVLAAGMLIPAAFSAIHLDWASARAFLYCAVFTGFASASMGVALATHGHSRQARGELLSLVICWVLVPAFAAGPLWLITPYAGPVGAWFEMASAFTTTGGTIFGEPESVPDSVHLWRGMVAWMGGLLTLAAAFAILAPRNLGGFEVTSRGSASASVTVLPGESSVAPFSERLTRALRVVLPIYAGFTAVLMLILSALGQDPVPAAVHAMAVMSTSGVSPFSKGLAESPSYAVEAVAAIFMLLAAAQIVYAAERRSGMFRRARRDPELRLLAVLVIAATLALFLRHWVGVLTVDLGDRVSEALPALWGAFFTCVSYLTTTGFESASWHTARDWSGLDNPGLILLGLCSVGGGAATTAGGIKLLRCYVLLRHGYRELERIAQPNSAMGAGARKRSIVRDGAFLAWAFVMLYSMGVFLTMIALTVTGMSFEDALVAALAAISNTGPAFDLVTPENVDFLRLSESQRVILAITMVIGRIEVLAVIALFKTDSWPRVSMRTKNTGNERRKTADSAR